MCTISDWKIMIMFFRIISTAMKTAVTK